MYKTLFALTTGAVLAFAAAAASVHEASAHEERCICTSTMAVPPVPPVPPVPAVAPLPPLPPHHADAGRHVRTKIVILSPDGSRQVRIVDGDGMHSLHSLRRVVRIEEHGDGERMTREAFMKRAERAFQEHDKNHDGVIDEKDVRDASDDDDDGDEEIELAEPPEAPEPPDAEDAPEAPEPPHPPRPPHH